MALHKAIIGGRLVQFRILLQGVKGINPNARDHDSKTPLMVCSSVSHERLSAIFATHLLSWGADVGFPDKYGRNALCWACWKGNPKLVEVLLDAYPDTCHYDLRQTDKNGNTALHYAALGGNELIVKMVIETFIAMNFSLNPPNKRGETPVTVAVKHNNIDGARVFVDIGQAQIFFDNSGKSTPKEWFESKQSLRDMSGSANTSLLMSDGRRVKSAFSGKKEVYRHNQRVEAEGGTVVPEQQHILSQIYNVFDSQFSSLYRPGAVTPPPEVPKEEPDLALGSAAQAVKFAHLLKQGKQDSRTPSTNDAYSSRGPSRIGVELSRSSSRYSLSKKKSSIGLNKDLSDGPGKGSGRMSSMRRGRSMSRARSRAGAGSSMGRARQRPMSRQQSMPKQKAGSLENKRFQNSRSMNRARLNSAKAKLRLPLRVNPDIRRFRRGSWPTDPATIRRLLPKEVDTFRSRGVNSMKRWRSAWDLDNPAMLNIGLDKSGQDKGAGRSVFRTNSKATPLGANKLQKITPRRGAKGGFDSFRKTFRSKFDFNNSTFVDVSDLLPSSPTLLTNRSSHDAATSSFGGPSPTPMSGRNKSPSTVRSKKGRNKEPVAEAPVQPVRSPGWVNRRIKILQEDIRILEARQQARVEKQKSILTGTNEEEDFLQKSLRSIHLKNPSEKEPRAGIVRQPTKYGNKDKSRKQKRVRIVTRQNSPGSSAKSGRDSSSDDSEFELSDEVKTTELLKVFLEKHHHFPSHQDRFLPTIIRRPAVAPSNVRGDQYTAAVSLTSKPRLHNRPSTSLYPGQGHIVSDAATLARYHNNPLSKVEINQCAGKNYNKKMLISKPVPGFWRPYRPIWMG